MRKFDFIAKCDLRSSEFVFITTYVTNNPNRSYFNSTVRKVHFFKANPHGVVVHSTLSFMLDAPSLVQEGCFIKLTQI